MTKVPRTIKHLRGRDPKADAMFVCGDLTNNGFPEEYDQLKRVFGDSSVVPESLPVYFLMGNHDHFSGASASDYYLTLGQPLHQHVEIKGYDFITISMTGRYGNDFNEEALAFLSESLAESATKHPGKPIFVFTHIPPLNTNYGSRDIDGWGTDVFDDILCNYPQVIIFSGHSHYPVGDPRSIHQDKFTAVNDGSVTYSEVERTVVTKGYHPEFFDQVTEGLIVKLDKKGNVTIHRYDTYDDTEILPAWTIEAPFDGSNFKYAGRTGGVAPSFPSNTKVSAVRDKKGQVIVTFTQACDDEVVHHYHLTLRGAQGEVLATYSQFSDYYLAARMPSEVSAFIDDVPEGVASIDITAFDSYDNESEAITYKLENQI